MPWLNAGWYPWNSAAITSAAPAASGVYAIASGREWIYIGEAGDVRIRLLQHFNGDNPCVSAGNPDQFSWELVRGDQPRVARQDALILEMRPRCNQR
jgi:excinuclease UvrABC nuclease subunit